MVGGLSLSTKIRLSRQTPTPLVALCRMPLQASRLRLGQALRRHRSASSEVAESALSVMRLACVSDS
jgi:hypothetical protein